MEKTRAQILGENLERIRKEKGYTRKQLADFLGINVVAIGLYETGKREPPLDKIFKLATFLEISTTNLISENGYAEIPNIAAIVDKKIFEYRYKRAVDITSTDFLFPTSELSNGNITVYIPAKVIRDENGILRFYGDESGNVGAWVNFKNKKVFVDIVEKAEQTAAQNYIPFYQSLKILLDNIIKK